MRQMAAFLAVVSLAAALVAPAAAVEGQQGVTLLVQGMSAGTEMKIEGIRRNIPGVAQVKASSVVVAVVVVYDPARAKTEEFIDAVQQAGLIAKLADARYRCPQCKATYSKDGKCIVCNVVLEPIG